MTARCETVGRYVMPVFRSLMAEELVHNFNLTQVEAAEKLGTTQAAISQYLNSKRAHKSIEQLTGVLSRIKAMAHETATKLANGEMSPDDVAAEICKLCSLLDDQEARSAKDDYSI
jgi:predicted transcriptional regulator